MKKAIKDFLYSKRCPYFVFEWYIQKKESKNRAKLLKFLAQESNLLNAVKEDQRPHWEQRIEKVINAPENENIPRIGNAGKIVDGNLVMHNGIKIDPLSYYSFPLLKMLIDNKGVHEPEEERIFQEVTKSLDSSKKMTMLELGSYWSFYSMWFLSQFPDANCFMVEPDRKNLFYGKKNFKLNNLKGTFIHSGISKEKNNALNITSVDAICDENKISFLDVLHSDIQGYELEMLHGAKKMFDKNKIGYVFISTHSDDLHTDCKQFLKAYNFIEVASADLQESSSWDGIIVMKSPHYKGIEKIDISVTKMKRK